MSHNLQPDSTVPVDTARPTSSAHDVPSRLDVVEGEIPVVEQPDGMPTTEVVERPIDTLSVADDGARNEVQAVDTRIDEPAVEADETNGDAPTTNPFDKQIAKRPGSVGSTRDETSGVCAVETRTEEATIAKDCVRDEMTAAGTQTDKWPVDICDVANDGDGAEAVEVKIGEVSAASICHEEDSPSRETCMDEPSTEVIRIRDDEHAVRTGERRLPVEIELIIIGFL